MKFVLIGFSVFSTLWVFDLCCSLEWGNWKVLRCHKAPRAGGFSNFTWMQWHWSKGNGIGEVWVSFFCFICNTLLWLPGLEHSNPLRKNPLPYSLCFLIKAEREAILELCTYICALNLECSVWMLWESV